MSRPGDCPTCQQAPGHPALGGYCSVHCRDVGELEKEIQDLREERDELLTLARKARTVRQRCPGSTIHGQVVYDAGGVVERPALALAIEELAETYDALPESTRIKVEQRGKTE